MQCHSNVEAQDRRIKEEQFPCFQYLPLIETGVNIPDVPKKYRRLISNRTKVFCLIFRISFIVTVAYLNLDFEIKSVEIR